MAFECVSSTFLARDSGALEVTYFFFVSLFPKGVLK